MSSFFHTMVPKPVISKITRFLGVGVVGFCIDAIVFFMPTQLFAVSYIWARVFASLMAMTTTWLLNRVVTFLEGRVYKASVELFRYILASITGADCNLACMSVIAPYDAALWHVPAYIVGAFVGLFVNYWLYNRFVFHGQTKARSHLNTPMETAE
jgi:putative flippase GtrA